MDDCSTNDLHIIDLFFSYDHTVLNNQPLRVYLDRISHITEAYEKWYDL